MFCFEDGGLTGHFPVRRPFLRERASNRDRRKAASRQDQEVVLVGQEFWPSPDCMCFSLPGGSWRGKGGARWSDAGDAA